MHEQPSYTIAAATAPLRLSGDWEQAPWAAAAVAEVDRFRPGGSPHRPRTQVKMLYDKRHLGVFFRVDDRYVRAVHAMGDDRVCKDSAVEFFVEPMQGHGYFNFEWNCGGAMYLRFNPPHEPPTEIRDSSVAIHHSLPDRIDPEITEPTTWLLQALIPLELLMRYSGATAPRPGTRWRANFYKCGSGTSHPHWASWAPLDANHRFHNPATFAPLVFGN